MSGWVSHQGIERAQFSPKFLFSVYCCYYYIDATWLQYHYIIFFTHLPSEKKVSFSNILHIMLEHMFISAT